MIPKFRGCSRINLAALIVALIAPRPSMAVPGHGKTDEDKCWTVKYMSGPIEVHGRGWGEGTELEAGKRIRVLVGPKNLVFKKGSRIVLAVPVDSVTSVAYYRENHPRTEQVLGVSEPDQLLAGIARCDQGIFLCAAIALPVYAVAAPFEYQKHFVSITWRDERNEDLENTLEIQVGKGDYRDFLAELSGVTGKPWRVTSQVGEETEPTRFDLSVVQLLNSPGLGKDAPKSLNEECNSKPSSERVLQPSDLRPVPTCYPAPVESARCGVLALDSEEYQKSCKPAARQDPASSNSTSQPL